MSMLPRIPIMLANKPSFWQQYRVLVLVLGALIVWGVYRRLPPPIRQLTPREALRLMHQKKPVIIDVRKPSAFVQGHLSGAISMPLKRLPKTFTQLPVDRARPLLVYSEWGYKSLHVCERLTADGFLHAYSLFGGSRGWAQENLPLVTGPTPDSQNSQAG